MRVPSVPLHTVGLRTSSHWLGASDPRQSHCVATKARQPSTPPIPGGAPARFATRSSPPPTPPCPAHGPGLLSLLEAPPRQASLGAPEAGAERGRAPVHGGPYAAPGPPCWGTSGQYWAPEAALLVPDSRLLRRPVPTRGRLCGRPGTPRLPRAQSPKAALGLGTRPGFLQCLSSPGLLPTPPLPGRFLSPLCCQPKAKSAC